jgi:hypothetical protein
MLPTFLPSFLLGLSHRGDAGATPQEAPHKTTQQQQSSKANPRLITTSTMTSVTAGYDTCPDWAPAL